MKKKFLIMLLLIITVFGFTACKKTEVNLQDFLIEERQNLFLAYDDLYTATLSSGMREKDYNFDGVVTEKTCFAILTLTRNDSKPLATDNYSYTITINNEQTTGFLEKSGIDNSYCIDLQKEISTNDVINVQISFTGYSFNKDLTNITNNFNVDYNTAINIANDQLKDDAQNLLKNNSKIEVVTKILCDDSNLDVNNYYWYIGVISNSGETMGVLIDSNSGEILAKKV